MRLLTKSIIIFSTLGLLLLAGCASREGYMEGMKALVGKERKELVETMGPPSSHYEFQGREYLVYQSSSMGTAGANTGVDPNPGPNIFHEGVGGVAYRKWCQTTFVIFKGRVESFQGKGNNCRQ